MKLKILIIISLFMLTVSDCKIPEEKEHKSDVNQFIPEPGTQLKTITPVIPYFNNVGDK